MCFHTVGSMCSFTSNMRFGLNKGLKWPEAAGSCSPACALGSTPRAGVEAPLHHGLGSFCCVVADVHVCLHLNLRQLPSTFQPAGGGSLKKGFLQGAGGPTGAGRLQGLGRPAGGRGALQGKGALQEGGPQEGGRERWSLP